jgi:kynureninase
MKLVREKSIQLSEMLIRLMQQECAAFGFELFSPRNAEKRGSQVSFTHNNGFSIMQALISNGVVGDFREPNVLRFGISPLYMRYVDIWDAVICLRKIMQTDEWQSEHFNQRGYVT